MVNLHGQRLEVDAATRLAMTQSVVSHALTRLRALLEDELFVCQSRAFGPLLITLKRSGCKGRVRPLPDLRVSGKRSSEMSACLSEAAFRPRPRPAIQGDAWRRWRRG